MSRMHKASDDNPDLFHEEHSARIAAARRRVFLARAERRGVIAAQRRLVETVNDVLREELGKSRE